MCDRCAALEEEITYLRQRLGDRLDDDLVRIILKNFGFTPAESKIVALLYRTRTTVPVLDIEDTIRVDHVLDNALSGNLVAVLISRIRRKRDDPGFIITIRRLGYALSDEARLGVAKAIEADKLATIEPSLKPKAFRSEKWTSVDALNLLELRQRGYTFGELAVPGGKTRNALIGKAWRERRKAQTAVVP